MLIKLRLVNKISLWQKMICCVRPKYWFQKTLVIIIFFIFGEYFKKLTISMTINVSYHKLNKLSSTLENNDKKNVSYYHFFVLYNL